jgi:hypothetical protein
VAKKLALQAQMIETIKSDSAVLHRITSLTRIVRLKRNFHFSDGIILSADETRFNISIDTLIDLPTETLIKSTNIELLTGEANKLAEFGHEFNFTIDGLHNYTSFLSRNTFEVENELNLWLNNVVIATSRGIIYTELQGTPLDDLILPLTNPDLIP